MKRYAFIDVQNTETTAIKVLGFEIDWKKLSKVLINDWGCIDVNLYPGIDYTDEQRQKVFQDLADFGVNVIPKYYRVYKVGDKVVQHKCVECNADQAVTIDMGYQWKCNCDVELTLDVMNLDFQHTEVLIFTGDGDFEYLVKHVIKKGGKVAIISTSRKHRIGGRYFTSRLSTKLKNLRKEYPNDFRIVELNNLKLKIKK